jgi:hypothetical protein
MHTITLTVSDEAKDKFLWLLSHFLPDEVKQEPIAQTAQSVITSGKQITDFLRQQIPLDWSNIGDPVEWQKQQRNESSPWETA